MCRGNSVHQGAESRWAEPKRASQEHGLDRDVVNLDQAKVEVLLSFLAGLLDPGASMVGRLSGRHN